MTALHTFTDSGFEEQVLKASELKPVLVDFWAPWCGPCRIVGPTIENVAESTSGRAVVGKLNVDDNPEVASKYGIQSIPTVLVFRNGNVTKSLVGVSSEQDYVDALEAAQGSEAA